LRAVARPPAAPALRAVVFLRAVARPPFAPALRAVVFLRVELVLRAVVLRADVFLRVELAFVLRALDFRVDVFFREDPERELELRAALLLPDERELEREDDRVVAGTARAISSTLSSSVVSLIVGAPHVSSAVS
jgi:hypothetical protein